MRSERRYHPLLLAFASNPQRATCQIDTGQPEPNQFGDSDARLEKELQDGIIARIAASRLLAAAIFLRTQIDNGLALLLG